MNSNGKEGETIQRYGIAWLSDATKGAGNEWRERVEHRSGKVMT